MSKHFPEDLLVEFFSRLPVKSLKRFKCVSKQWRALIERPEFIKMHLERSALRVVMGTPCTELPERYCLSSVEEFGSKESFLRARKEAYCPLEDFPGRKSWEKDQIIGVVGSCNGLICVRYSKYDVLVWNPWIRRHWIIPRTRVETRLAPGCRRELPYRAFTYGFGYDDLNDDYKVVRMVQLQTNNGEPLGVEVKVFSMKSNSWRRIQDFPYAAFDAFRMGMNLVAGVLANGALHWVLSNCESNPPNSIMAIDLATEEYRILPMPEPGKNFCLCGFYGKLCFFTGKMWEMDRDSWRIGIDMELPEDVSLYTMQPLAYSENDRNLIFLRDQQLLWVNYNGSAVRTSVCSPPCDIICSVASLVEPNCGGKKGIKCKCH